jgi:hypothetical protein
VVVASPANTTIEITFEPTFKACAAEGVCDVNATPPMVIVAPESVDVAVTVTEFTLFTTVEE